MLIHPIISSSLKMQKHYIQPNYRTYPYKCTVKQSHSLKITAHLLFVYFFIKANVDKGIYCEYPFELHRLVDAIQMSTHNIWGMFEMNCLLSSSSISMRGTIKTNTCLYRAIQYLHNGIQMYMLD